MKWTSIEDKMPKINQRVLVWMPGCSVKRDIMVWENYAIDGAPNPHWYNADYHCNVNDYPKITHWMPLPEPPDGK